VFGLANSFLAVLTRETDVRGLGFLRKTNLARDELAAI